MKRIWVTGMALTILAAWLVGLGTVSRAPADDKKEDAVQVKADPVSDDVRHIALAYDLAEYGRKAKSPEMLVSAARILRKIRTTPGTEKPTIEGGKDEKEEKAEAVSLLEESNHLLAEARKLAPDDALIGDLIERITKEKTRGSIGGPRSHYHKPGAGTTMTWNVSFAGGQPASVAVQGNGRNALTLTVRGPGGHFLTWTGPNPSLSWVPRQTKPYTITVTNDGPGACAYRMYHN